MFAAFAAGAFAREIRIPCEKFVLPNGLTVLVHEDHKSPIVALNIWHHVGSKNEKSGKTGCAHFFEHLMFGGSIAGSNGDDALLIPPAGLLRTMTEAGSVQVTDANL
jgi:predicted Zn-dependent peptidase